MEQGLIGELGDGGKALGQDLSVAAMRAVDVVIHAEKVRLADSGGFLPDGEVGRAAVGTFLHAL